MRLWDGTYWPSERAIIPRFTLVLRHPGALRSMLLRPGGPNQLSFGEAYIYDDVDIEGDVHAVFPVVEHVLAHRWTAAEQMKPTTTTRPTTSTHCIWTSRWSTRHPQPAASGVGA